ncbi:MAG: hypothetical protein H0T47_13065 [Planctomycetaceae bacterium]|nr:hypothetical protein [Planctomycetaceae bacterium]
MERVIRLTPFEAYMWADDSARHPMTALIEIEYSGRLQRSLFEAALSQTLLAHPLLRAVIDDTCRPPRWIVQENASPFLHWDDEFASLEFPNGVEHIDLTAEVGLRVWVRAGEESGRVVLQLHHACTDGVGVTNFVTDFLRAYAALGNGEAVPTLRDHGALEWRDRFYKRPWLGRLKTLYGVATHARTWRRSRPIPLRDEDSGKRRSKRPMDSISHRVLDTPELEGLVKAAHEADVTVNDLMLRDLLQVLAPRCEHRATGVDDCVCVCMPVNLRAPEDAPMPAANKMFMSFLRRTPAQCRDAEGLLRSVREETSYIKRTRRGLRMLEVFRLAMLLRGEVPQALLKKGSFATAVLSNLGRLVGQDVGLPTDEDGRLLASGITVERLITAPNGRPGTAAVFVILTYAGRMIISLRFDPESLSDDSAQELLDAFVERLRATAAVPLPEAVLV